MSMDWLKIRCSLATDPRVLTIADAIDESVAAVVGALVILWSAASTHSTEGTLPRATPGSIDRMVGLKGFADALVQVDWLRFTQPGDEGAPGGGAVIPRWGDHNSETARRRAEDALRKARARAQDGADARWGRDKDERPKSVRKTADTSRTRAGQKHAQEQEQEQEKKTDAASAASPAADREDATPPTGDSGASRAGRAGGVIAWSREAGWSGVTDEDRERWAKAYPAVDLDRQLAAMHEWLLAHPREAVKRNWLRFITGWLTRQQERGGDVRTERRRDGPVGANGTATANGKPRTDYDAIQKKLLEREGATR